MKKIKLTLVDRFALLSKLPQKGKLQVMAAANAVRKKIDITSQDVTDFKIEDIVTDDGQSTGIKWDPEVDTTKEFTFDNDAEVSVLINIFKKMDEAEEITPAQVEIATEILSWEDDTDKEVAELVKD